MKLMDIALVVSLSFLLAWPWFSTFGKQVVGLLIFVVFWGWVISKMQPPPPRWDGMTGLDCDESDDECETNRRRRRRC